MGIRRVGRARGGAAAFELAVRIEPRRGGAAVNRTEVLQRAVSWLPYRRRMPDGGVTTSIYQRYASAPGATDAQGSAHAASGLPHLPRLPWARTARRAVFAFRIMLRCVAHRAPELG
jgi:hypothetical protein